MENPTLASIKSADEDEHDFTDADAAIDRMLDELQDFQFELESNTENKANGGGTTLEPLKSEPKSPRSPRSPKIETVTSSLDHLRFSTIAIEDSGDVDLDALLEDLCSMEKDIMSSTNDSGVFSNSSNTLGSSNANISDAASFQGNNRTLSPKSPKSPVPANVTSDVRNRLESLQQETQELTPEEQEERIKKEKIKIALEKMKAASVQKLVVKVFDDNLETSKTLAIDQLWTVRDVVSKMVKKNDVEVDPNWSLIERLPDMHLERIMEEHENVLPVVFDWTRDTNNMLVFSKRRDKYTLFRNPQNFLLASGTSAGAAQLAEASKDILLEEFFTREHTRIPEVEGVLWLKEGKKTWQKHYFVLRASGIYYTPKGKSKQSRDLICLVKFEHANVYSGVGMKKKYRAPTDNVFCLKHPKVQTLKSKHVFFLCAEDQKTMYQWVVSIKMAKFGYDMYDNYLQTQQNVEKELMLTSLANRGTATVKFQDEEDDVPDKAINKRRPSATYKEGTQSKSSSLSRVKGQGASNLGSLFANAWKKGIEESSEDITSPGTPLAAAEDIISPDQPLSTFSIANRASSMSSRSSSGRGSLDLASSKASSQSSSSNRGSLKSSGSFDEQSKSFQLEPVPPKRNNSNSQSNNHNNKALPVFQAPPPPPLPPPAPPLPPPAPAPPSSLVSNASSTIPAAPPPPMLKTEVKEERPVASAAEKAASEESTVDDLLDALMEDVQNNPPPPPQSMIESPPPSIVESPTENTYPLPPAQDPVSPVKKVDQSLDELMEDMTDFLPPPPSSLTASPNLSETSNNSVSPSFEFPPPPPPLPPTRGSSIHTKE